VLARTHQIWSASQSFNGKPKATAQACWRMKPLLFNETISIASEIIADDASFNSSLLYRTQTGMSALLLKGQSCHILRQVERDFGTVG